MKESVNNEISNLFQELIVSKIIDELEVKINELETSTSEVYDKVNSLPKTSGIKKILNDETTKIKEYVDDCFGRVKTVKYLEDIVTFLKKHYNFPNRETLCNYLENISTVYGEKIDTVISSQSDSNTKLQELNVLLSDYKDNIMQSIDGGNAEISNELQQYFKQIGEFQECIENHVRDILDFNSGNIEKWGEVSRNIKELNDIYCNIVNKMGDMKHISSIYDKKIDTIISSQSDSNSKLQEFNVLLSNHKDNIMKGIGRGNTEISNELQQNFKQMEESQKRIENHVRDLLDSNSGNMEKWDESSRNIKEINDTYCNIVKKIDEHESMIKIDYNRMEKKIVILAILNSVSIVGIIFVVLLQFIL